ncbi:MAG: BatA domain-containing protein, partial [Alphaproteobacteria bacterium]|nr:BatA domain-containing protein [Alphaproteobacteria bacterium]
MPLLPAIGFETPIVLAALAALPLLWWLMRATPPAPRRLAFPFIRLVMDEAATEETPARTPWWLMALRLALAAALILAAAGPVLNPQRLAPLDRPLLLVIDDGWASAPGWQAMLRTARNAIARADAGRQPIGLLTTAARTGPARLDMESPEEAARRLEALAPQPWETDRSATLEALADLDPGAPRRILWLTDGLAGTDGTAFGRALAELGDLAIAEPGAEALPFALGRVRIEPGHVVVPVQRPGGEAVRAEAAVIGRNGEVLGAGAAAFEAGATEAEARIALPVEVQDDILLVRLTSRASAGATALIDDASRFKRVGLAETGKGSQPLLSPDHYLAAALADLAHVEAAPLEALLARPPGLILLDDSVGLLPETRAALTAFLEGGGMVVRFAGPTLAKGDDTLVPAPLRRGGRTLGGALDWTEPQGLQAFDAASPFAGLPIPEDVVVRRQVLAQSEGEPGVENWARLADGTPLVTARNIGKGLLVLFHVSATPGWSDLPLSGLFQGMLGRLVALAAGSGSGSGPDGAGETLAGRLAAGGAALAPRFALDGL